MYSSTILLSCLATIALLFSTSTTALPIPGSRNRHLRYKTGGVTDDLETRDTTAMSTAPAVIRGDFPDPSFIRLADANYAFATSLPPINIQVAKSVSFSNPSWNILNIDALPDPGPWTDRTPNIWAPYVAQTPSGTFVMYYSAPPTNDPTKHCIGTATSKTITGPYTPSPAPFVCDLSRGGNIDASIFKDPRTGLVYAMYKIDGNSLSLDGKPNSPTPIMLQQIDPNDLVTKVPGTSPVQIFDQDTSSTANDGTLVEAPTMMYANGVYYLLFSTNDYTTEAYDVRYVTSSTSATGPYSKSQTVLLKTGDGNGIVGPGSCDVHDGMIAFHGRVKKDPLKRYMFAGYVKAGQGGLLSYVGSVGS